MISRFKFSPKLVLHCAYWFASIQLIALTTAHASGAITLQDLFGAGRREAIAPAVPSPHRQLTPITREGLQWGNSLGGGLNPQGYYNRSFTPEEMWGVRVPDGTVEQPLFHEMHRITPQRRRLADGTIYFDLPQGAVRANLNGQRTFYTPDPANTVVFTIEGGRVTRQQMGFEYQGVN